LIYKTYELHPSETETLPEDPDEAPMREFMRDHPEGRGIGSQSTGRAT
jgi:hypothetical protein